MALSVADIDRWSAEAVREVFHAANARAKVTFDASRQLGSLSVFESWNGEARKAAEHQNAGIRRDLDAHGNEALAVAHAAGKAADGIDKVKANLAGLRRDAANLGMEIDPVTDQVNVQPSSRYTTGEWSQKQQQRADFQARLNAILAEANGVDQNLATAINMADGDKPIPAGPHDNRPQIQDALSKPLPDDPKQFNDLWNHLTPEEKDWLYSQDHSIGNHPGMPWDPPDHLGADHYNRLHLPELQQNAQADVDRMQRRVDQLLSQVYMGDHSQATTAELNTLRPQLLAARHSLDGYKAVQADLDRKDGVHRCLGFIDDKGHAAVAVNNPDYAKRNALFVPGTAQDLPRLQYSDEKAVGMYNATRAADKSLGPADVSVTTWMGYDRPMDLGEAWSPDRARAGAGSLDAFESGMRASHVGAPSIDTVIGHSYGSTLVGAAASGGHHLDANNVIAVGSPGMLVQHASDLSLAQGAGFYAMRAANDPIGVAGVATVWSLGPEPVGVPDFGGTELASSPGPSWHGLPDIEAHSSYWAPGNVALANMGAVIAGVAPPQIVGPPQ